MMASSSSTPSTVVGTGVRKPERTSKRTSQQTSERPPDPPSSVSARRRLYFPTERERRRVPKEQLQPLHVPASVRCPPVRDPFGCAAQPAVRAPLAAAAASSTYSMRFAWLDKQKNNSSGETSSRKVAAKDTSHREVENWYFMYFRFRMQGYQSLVYAVKQSVKDESIFSEDHIDKWTLKLRFRIRRASPLKEAQLACVNRLGLENDPDVAFCLDGFLGDTLTGRVHNKNEIPNQVMQSTSTCRAMGLCNGSCVFVSRATRVERANAAIQLQLDLLRNLDVDNSDSQLESSSLTEARLRATRDWLSRTDPEANNEGIPSRLVDDDYRLAESRRDHHFDEIEVCSAEDDNTGFGRYGSDFLRRH